MASINNRVLRQYNVKHYSGPTSKMPDKLPFGDFYFDEELNILYKYNYQGIPIPIGNGGGGGTTNPSQINYNYSTDQQDPKTSTNVKVALDRIITKIDGGLF